MKIRIGIEYKQGILDMKLYLDTCCYNRPYDDRTQEKVYIEGEAIQQFENGYGDYTKEKYQQPDLPVEDIDLLLKKL